MFQLRAAKSINAAYALKGKPDGTFEWGTNNVFNDLGSSAIAAKSLSPNGYIRFASGLIWQWGGIVATDAGTTVTYPLTFSTFNEVVITTWNMQSAGIVGSPWNSGFTCKVISGVNAIVAWHAIGY